MNERYQSKEMKELWSLKHRYETFLKVELAVLDSYKQLGVIPEEDVKKIKANTKVDLNKILELENIYHHDVIAFTRSLKNNLGSEAKWIHYGLTSTDVVDTANGILFSEANNLIFDALEKLIEVVKDLALKHKNTLMMGRTHGVHADITTFGFKFAYYYDALGRVSRLLAQTSYDVEVGKISGAVGNYANIDPQIEKLTCVNLGIEAASISTQVLARDRYANYFANLTSLASILEMMATEIRLLAQTEIGEVQEYFDKNQKGSSAMPHKRNPISCENICGCARLMRGYMLTSFENINLWHERDISHSSAERVIFEDATSLIEYMLNRMTKILSKIVVNEDRMLENINLTNKNIYSQRVMTKLIEKGMLRETAYDLIQQLAFRSTKDKDFLMLVKENETVKQTLSNEEIDECFTNDYYVKNMDKIYEEVGLI